ncbi:MAG: ABC transporter ATP-binding protein [Gammaproteobacteria bacterium]|nr:MAG: ABC transporter ATP-binding protein [Gammaproteobacteria bacterium]
MNELLKLEHISMAYGKHTVVHDVSFTLKEGDIGCLLGPSGCGKTTLLRAIAGFETPQAGNISIRGVQFSGPGHVLVPEKRRIGMVFQDFALFPHLSVFDNVGFGLHKSMGKQAIAQRVNELLELIGLATSGNKYPHQLSGGQQQRVALARALAPRPDLLLLDEPFSSLDVELRQQLSREVRKILKQEGITAILVTHDQQEAFAMADYVGLILQGRLAQWDSGYNLYHRPISRAVADFIGEGTFIAGEVMCDYSIKTELGLIHGKVPEGCREGCTVDVLIRPDDLIHDDSSPIALEVTEKFFRGSDFIYTLKLGSGQEVLCIAPSHHNHALGAPLGITLDVDHLVVFKRQAA